MEDYYITANQKVIDFFKGFFGTWIFMSSYFLIIIYIELNAKNKLLIFVLYLLLIIVFIVMAFKKGRRYIGIGIPSSFLFPLLILVIGELVGYLLMN
ncbi:MAG: hypothetical protein QT05_C0042G0014 [archaeon GW2011_AR13]|nr:MAG: hypothetical protein QT05_C0042G0014 [archaeon GW2011_AR13]